ncbi:uncharacterized protein N7500_006761 [Penicillium coprophilum]|uniref:uncharacterized protein n=1 Tax=Penicillium coprophilum TaxID=36646 RepID=UPI00238274BC|nr:uncharacterized protein N7500_006761 [Penicillium coprophilum]KAJ5164931.1 hypothetical protein N7500_006761 [Penicillium coprophilum]
MVMPEAYRNQFQEVQKSNVGASYGGNSKLTEQKRLALTVLALADSDPECLQIMADAFQETKGGFLHHIYWDDLINPDEATKTFQSGDNGPFAPDSCVVM